jgi:hypothetical protein
MSLRFYGMLKNPTGMKRILRGQNSLPFLAKFSFFVIRCLCCNFQTALLDESGMIRTQMGSTIDQKWSQCMGRFVRYNTQQKQQQIIKLVLEFRIICFLQILGRILKVVYLIFCPQFSIKIKFVNVL